MKVSSGLSVKTGLTVLAVAVSIACGCTTGTFHEESALTDRYHPAGKDGIRAMIDGVTAINRKSPESCNLDFNIEGTYGEKKNRMLGSLQFNRKQHTMNVSVVDFIFRSPLMTLLLEGDVIRVYYPAEKKMYIDNARTINLANYGGFNIDFSMFHDLITGVIPLIEGYSVKQGLASNDGKGLMLILENSRFYETVSFQRNEPDKILLINKKTREKIEIYVNDPVIQGGSRIYSKVMIVAKNIPLRFEITFKRILLNTPVRVKTFKDLKIPNGLQVVQM
jgi:hypothetical protein